MASPDFIFVGGLPRSGTTLLATLLSEHPDISQLSKTGVPHDEGVFLQRIYPTDSELGGPGVFGFHHDAHWTEARVRDAKEMRAELLSNWQPYWNQESTVFLEKSTGNMLRSRFLQALFPGAVFVVIRRHPVAQSLAVMKWGRHTLARVMQNWFRCQSTWASDRSCLNNSIEVSYEALTADPLGTVNDIFLSIGLSPLSNTTVPVKRGVNDKYFSMYRLIYQDRYIRFYLKAIHLLYRKNILRWGYAFADVWAEKLSK